MSDTQRILVFGATSAICHEVLKHYATQGTTFFITGRNAERLDAIGQDLCARGGIIAGQAAYDFNDWAQHEPVIGQAREALGAIDLALVAHGSLPEQSQCEQSDAAVWACVQDNFASAAIIIHGCARVLDEQGKGSLAVISSVAGDRGRKSNYTYGATKAGLDALLQGLQGRFAGTAVKVINIKPGMVHSPMTEGMGDGLLWATPQAIAPTIISAISKGKRLCYVPGYWRLVMLVIRALPTTILAKLPI